MKNSLLFSFGVVFIFLLFTSIPSGGQTIVFSENFSGFSSSTHSSPSTSDASGSLDSKTQIPGWTGYKIYSAGGEIKIGIEAVTGWIETPVITFSGYEGILTLRFDICRWPGDATSVRVMLDGLQIGTTLTPADEFQTIEIPLPPGVQSGKIKFEAISKRFYLDNVSVISGNTPTAINPSLETDLPLMYPNPVKDLLTIRNLSGYEIVEIIDTGGRIHFSVNTMDEELIQLSLSEFRPGIYLIRFSSGNSILTMRLVKLP